MTKVVRLKLAVESNNFENIDNIMNGIENKNTAVSYYYKFIRGKVDKDIQDKLYAIYVEPLISTRIEEYKYSVKETKTIRESDIKEIIENKDRNEKYKTIYIILLTGRRLKEVLDNPEVMIKDGKLYMKLAKKKDEDKKFYHIYILGNLETPENIKKMIEEVSKKINYKSAATLLRRILKPYGISSHDLRGVYIELISKFFNPENRNKSGLVLKYLNHQLFQKSYDHINYEGGNPFDNGYNKMTVKDLKKLAKKRGLKRYSRLKKSELISLLS